MQDNIENDEYLGLANELSLYHSIFYKFWLLGKPRFSDEVPTAAVAFNKEGNCIDFMVNKQFWSTKTITQKAFIISHECQHVIREHGLRMSFSGIDVQLANIAMDLTINHDLVNYYRFDRSQIDPNSDYCWIDTVFKDHSDIVEGQSFEYYYNKLIENQKNINMPKLVDGHDFLESFPESAMNNTVYIEFTQDEMEEIEEMITDSKDRGSHSSSRSMTMANEKVKVKRKWEDVIKKWARKYFVGNKEDSQWIRSHRRHSLLDSSLILPSDMEVDEKDFENKKIDVFLFLDTSGSCASLAPKFWRAARSLPTDKFNLNLFCFSDRVYPVNLKDKKLYGFGGTSFGPISSKVTNVVTEKNIKDYAVFILTDGEGTRVRPLHPEKWHWFLTSGGYAGYIPPESHIYKLSDYE